MKPRLLDLFCGAGGAAMGYHRAGFDVVGVDIRPQPNYPFKFIQADALDTLDRLSFGLSLVEDDLRWHVEDFDAIHASPPCQAYTAFGKALARAPQLALDVGARHPDLISATRDLIRSTGLPYVIENVEGAPLLEPVRLCGSSFRAHLGAALRRHRLFESNVLLSAPPCDHSWQTERLYWNGDRSRRLPDGSREYDGEHRLSTVVQVYGNAGGREHWPAALGIDWMTYDELRVAIPPAYTELIGHQLMQHVKARAAA